jgi:DNA ligase-1
MHQAWHELDQQQRFVWNKLISGGFRVGVSEQLVARALAEAGELDVALITHRLMGDWIPSSRFFTQLLAHEPDTSQLSRPYPFFLAHALDQPLVDLGERSDWQAEWKWDGIRCQLIRRAGQTFLWSRGEELVTPRYPELATVGHALPDGTVIDGEILPSKEGAILPFTQLQRRIGRKAVTQALLVKIPVILIAYDLLEHNGQDFRTRVLTERRASLTNLVEAFSTNFPQLAPLLQLSPVVEAPTWSELTQKWEVSREKLAEGLMLKRRHSVYGAGRWRGDWWKWKIKPYTIDAVLTAAQRGSGKRASLYTDYTFSIWNKGTLVPIAKAYSGLTNAEIREVDAFIQRNMIEKFGPVRTVKPELVFELAFEGLNRSSRHKSGIALRFPRILRWRMDKKATEADTVESVRPLLPPEPTV